GGLRRAFQFHPVLDPYAGGIEASVVAAGVGPAVHAAAAAEREVARGGEGYEHLLQLAVAIAVHVVEPRSRAPVGEHAGDAEAVVTKHDRATDAVLAAEQPVVEFV